MAAHDCLRCDRPGETDARREVVLFYECRVVIPTQAEIQGKVMAKLPVVLGEHCVVVVAQMDLVRLVRKSARRRHRKETRINWTVGYEVIDGRKELKRLHLRFDTIDSCPQEIPAELEVVIAKEFAGVG